MSVETKAERVTERLVRWTNGFPKPGPKQGVRADVLAKAIGQLKPIAVKIAGLAEGTPKGGFSGAGFLTGSTITADDRACANRVLYEIDTRLPMYGSKSIEPWLLSQIKERCQRLLTIACDMDIDETLMDKVSRAWETYTGAIIDLPVTLYEGLTEIAPIPRLLADDPRFQKPIQDAMSIGTIALIIAGVLGGAYVLGKVAGG